MANLITTQTMLYYLRDLIEQHVVTEDDQLIFDAFCQSDIRHACQAIRHAKTGEVEFQHLTLRFGSSGEQSVYQFDLSRDMGMCLDLYSLYLALRQTQFQLETFHPDLISNVVVPICLDTLLWPPGAHFLEQIIAHHSDAFRHIIPSLQGDDTLCDHQRVAPLSELLHENAYAVWFEMATAQKHFEHIAKFSPDMIKLAVSLEDKQDRQAFLPIARFLRRHRYPWVAGRVASHVELNRYMLLGASYYFGYFSDIPTSLSFKLFEEEETENCN
ncbi:diguanylate phosphodiesterase [Vibrio sp. CAU 1672]|uniref:diguanylate phosphodiesterase n=1 Tax=Vibrio sp. CAU 1672 TaxID=3032594 RepID=UPI0023DB202A|nr:diguanylate phosphodiesterase [Vibrio sp. CAU 1672]MDF2152614.1 diguanylate phosphodiesterase [Vibrio sp. CAU 1672]